MPLNGHCHSKSFSSPRQQTQEVGGTLCSLWRGVHTGVRFFHTTDVCLAQLSLTPCLPSLGLKKERKKVYAISKIQPLFPPPSRSTTDVHSIFLFSLTKQTNKQKTGRETHWAHTLPALTHASQLDVGVEMWLERLLIATNHQIGCLLAFPAHPDLETSSPQSKILQTPTLLLPSSFPPCRSLRRSIFLQSSQSPENNDMSEN